MKTQILKLFAFWFLSSIFLFHKASAQIVYTDIPDTTLSANGPAYQLDLNNDGIADFNIQYSTYTINFSSCGGTRTNGYYKIYPLHGDAIQNQNNYPKEISQNNTVSASSLTWNTDSVQLLYSLVYSCGHSWGYTTSGNWSTDYEGYLGLKLIANGNSYYGWVRISRMGGIIIKDYAFNSTANQQIKTGQTASATAFMSWLGSTEYCTGNTISIPYLITGTFNPGNIFTAQLSDSSGNFTSPLNIGTHAGQNAGSISVTFPSTAKSSHLYRIRIASSNPASTGPDNAQELSIGIINNITSYGTVICQPSGLVYLSAHGSSPSYSYQWTKNGIPISGATSASYTTITGGNFACTITNSCGTVNSNVISLNTGSYPAATITPSGTAEACPGSPATLYANTGTGLTYQWLRRFTLSGYIPISGATNATYAAPTGYYQVKVTNSSGCSKLSTTTNVSNSTPQASISNRRPLTFCAGDSTVLKTTNNSAYQYQWKKNNVNIPGANSYKYTAFTSGNYKVKVTNQNGNCDSISKVKTVTVSCRNSNENVVESLEHISIYPNPATNSVTIKFSPDSNRDDEEGTIQIVNLFGQIVFSEKVIPIAIRTEQKQIDVSRFPAGMYVVRWSSGGNNETKTFSVIK